MITPEEKLLRAVLKDTQEERGYPVKQEPPICPRCKMRVDITDETVRVDYRDIKKDGRTFTVAEPYCPVCSTKIEAKIYINN